MKIQLGKKQAELSAAELRERIGDRSVLIDLGTGDGSFVHRRAREDASCFCIGIDPVGEAMAVCSSKALKKPAKGGAPNALFVVASVLL